jgi:hypothetical protein
MVPKAGLEPARVSPLPPQDSVSTRFHHFGIAYYYLVCSAAGAGLCPVAGAELCCVAGAVVFTFSIMEAVFPFPNIKASIRHVIIKIIAAAVVIFVKKEVAPAPPKRVWLVPPKAAPMSEPLPFCKRTIRISATHTMICRITIITCIEGSYLTRSMYNLPE